MINPLREKYHNLYWDMAWAAATQSVARRHRVGAVVVTPTGMISVGWNGMPASLPNSCENRMVVEEGGHSRPKTDPRVIHAERNALSKMARQGVPAAGSLVFITRSPCLECAKTMVDLDLAGIHFHEFHDCLEGLKLFDAVQLPWSHRFGRNHERAS